jgi:transposase
MPKSRRSYDREVKIEAVRLATRGDKTATQVARDLGLNSNNLSRWKRDLTDDPGFAFPAKGKLKPADEDLRRLNKELLDITEECDILKKALAIFSRTPIEMAVHRTTSGLFPRWENGGSIALVAKRLLCSLETTYKLSRKIKSIPR